MVTARAKDPWPAFRTARAKRLRKEFERQVDECVAEGKLQVDQEQQVRVSKRLLVDLLLCGAIYYGEAGAWTR